MATVKIPYTYTVYQNSKLGTRVDRFCHMPSRIVWIFLICFLLMGYYAVCFSVLPVPENVLKVLGMVGAVLIFVLFIGSFFLGILCDKLKISARVALWDIGGRKVSNKLKIVIAVLAALLILPGISALGVTIAGGIQGNAYQKTMSVLENPEAVAVEGNKAVTCVDGRYSKLYIPEEMQAEKPEEVRYILKCTDGEELFGYYGVGRGIAGYRRCRTIDVIDRKSGQVLHTQLFYGSNPPNYVSDDAAKKQYGSMPSEERICEWLAQVLPGAQ